MGCVSAPYTILPACSPQITTLSNYDKYSQQFLDESTKHPTRNVGGQVVWGSRYYLESLITAYAATKNPKYLRAFEDSGTAVMNLVQDVNIVDVPDPSAPGKFVTQPVITRTGWPTYLADFGTPIAVPTSGGAISFYAQSLYPSTAPGAYYVHISQQANGDLQFAWSQFGVDLKTYPLGSLSDLNAIADDPLIYGKSLGRIQPTGLGLPAPGSYYVGAPLTTIWSAEQNGGISLPFARYLMIAKADPSVADPTLVAAWRTKILEIASQYASDFVSDGNGGYIISNPQWMPNQQAGTYAESDYVWAEVSLRILLYELTDDSKQLALARGLLQHQVQQNISTNSNGWLVLRDWPDIHPWTTRSEAPTGSVWSSFSANPNVAEKATDGGFFVEMLHLAATYNLTSTLGISSSLLQSQTDTYHEYLLNKTNGFLRNAYPTLQAGPLDPFDPSLDQFAGSGYLEPETSSAPDWIANWQWMTSNGTSPSNQPIGYFLRAWARSETAMSEATCSLKP